MNCSAFQFNFGGFRFSSALLALVLSIGGVGCGDPGASPSSTGKNCRTVSQVLGETTVCDRPKKVAVLDVHSLDLLLSLGEQSAGVVTPLPISTNDTSRVQRPDIAIPYLGDKVTTQPTYLGSLGRPPSLEVLSQSRPDLIVGESWQIQGGAGALMAKLAPTLPLAPRSERGNWRKNLRALAQALGDEALADRAIARYRRQIDAARRDLKSVIKAHPRVLILTGESMNKGVLFVLTGEGYIGEVLESIGFDVVEPPGPIRNFIPLSIEILPELNQADLIFVLGYTSAAIQTIETEDLTNTKSLLETKDALVNQQVSRIRTDWQNNPIAQSLKASKSDRVYFHTFYEWNVLNGPLGAELILTQLRESLLDN